MLRSNLTLVDGSTYISATNTALLNCRDDRPLPRKADNILMPDSMKESLHQQQSVSNSSRKKDEIFAQKDDRPIPPRYEFKKLTDLKNEKEQLNATSNIGSSHPKIAVEKPMKSILSVPSLQESISSCDEMKNISTHESGNKMKKSISFSHIAIREHELEIGNNPACIHGPAITFGWDVLNERKVDFEEYEQDRKFVRRSFKDLKLNSSERMFILRDLGFSQSSIRTSTYLKQKDVCKRKVTIDRLKFSRIEEKIEDFSRKVKKVTKIKGSLTKSQSCSQF